MTNKQKARFLHYALTLADHVIDGKPAFPLDGFYHDPHVFDGVSVDDLHNLIGDWDSDLYSAEEVDFEGDLSGSSIVLTLDDDPMDDIRLRAKATEPTA